MLQKTCILFSLAVGLCIAAIFLHPPLHIDRLKQPDLTIFTGFDFSAIQKIILNSGTAQLLLQRMPTGWKLEYRKRDAHLQDVADDVVVINFLQTLSTLVSCSPPQKVADNEWVKYGLSNLETFGDSIQIQYSNTQQILHFGFNVSDNTSNTSSTSNIVLANNTPSYARLNQSNILLQVPGEMRFSLQNIRESPDDWRSRKIFHISKKNFPLIWAWQKFGTEKIIIIKEEGIWQLKEIHGNKNTSPFQDRVSPYLIQKLESFASTAKIQDFVNASNITIEEFRDSYLLGYQTQNEKVEFVLVGNKVKKNSHTYYYVARAEITLTDFYSIELMPEKLSLSHIYLVDSYWLKDIPLSLEQWIDPKILRFTEENIMLENISSIKKKSQFSWILSQNSKKNWELEEPKKMEIETKKVSNFFYSLDNLQSQKFQRTDIPHTLDSLAVEINSNKTYYLEWFWEKENIFVRQNIYIFDNNRSSHLLYQDTLWRNFSISKHSIEPIEKTTQNTQFLSTEEIFFSSHFQFYNTRVDAFIYGDVEEVQISSQKNNIDIISIKSQKENISETTSYKNYFSPEMQNVLRHCAWIMADEVLGEKEDASKFQCCEELAQYCLKIITPQQQKKIFIGQNLLNGGNAIVISDFPYIYAVGSELRKAIENFLQK